MRGKLGTSPNSGGGISRPAETPLPRPSVTNRPFPFSQRRPLLGGIHTYIGLHTYIRVFFCIAHINSIESLCACISIVTAFRLNLNADSTQVVVTQPPNRRALSDTVVRPSVCRKRYDTICLRCACLESWCHAPLKSYDKEILAAEVIKSHIR